MRTKTLLIAAAALAVGVATSLAQTYSMNVVGYYNITVPANKTGLIAVQLNDGNGNYGINTQLINGINNNSTLLVWNRSSFDSYVYYTGYGWYDELNNVATNQVPAGTSAYLVNGDPANPMTVTVVGQVPQPTNSPVAIPAGYGFYAIPSPISTNVDSTLVSFPSQNNDVYFQWLVSSQTFYTYVYYTGYGWYDENNNLAHPTPNVGEGFLYQNALVSTNWNFTFTVQ